MPYAVIILHANGQITRSTQDKKPELEQLQKAVQGYIETVPYLKKLEGHKRGTAFVNEEGLIKGLPLNRLASLIWAQQFPGATWLAGDLIYYAKIKEAKPLTEDKPQA